jgi:hypothetical protein
MDGEVHDVRRHPLEGRQVLIPVPLDLHVECTEGGKDREVGERLSELGLLQRTMTLKNAAYPFPLVPLTIDGISAVSDMWLSVGRADTVPVRLAYCAVKFRPPLEEPIFAPGEYPIAGNIERPYEGAPLRPPDEQVTEVVQGRL